MFEKVGTVMVNTGRSPLPPDTPYPLKGDKKGGSRFKVPLNSPSRGQGDLRGIRSLL